MGRISRVRVFVLGILWMKKIVSNDLDIKYKFQLIAISASTPMDNKFTGDVLFYCFFPTNGCSEL